MKICATVITYNRIEFLKEIIDALRNQTRRPDGIIVVNNSSTDGTEDWLNQQVDLTVFKQENIGSSGGQWRAFKEAFDLGYDWIWTMDDDVVPENNALEILIAHNDEDLIRAPLRYKVEGEPFFNDAISYNLTNPFRSIWNDIYSQKDLGNEKTEVVGITFEGPLFHRSLIERIGLPEKPFFIYADDTEFFIRAHNAGFKIMVFRDAKLNRKLKYQGDPSEFNWKTYYLIRNIIAIDRIHGNFAVKWIRPFGYLVIWIKRGGFKNLGLVLKAFKDGMRYKQQ
jgi:GT2 family glycosyltransferase